MNGVTPKGPLDTIYMKHHISSHRTFIMYKKMDIYIYTYIFIYIFIHICCIPIHDIIIEDTNAKKYMTTNEGINTRKITWTQKAFGTYKG